MGGGPSTPALAAAVSGAGGLGFLAAGYKALDAVRADLEELRALLPDRVPFGINVFAPPGHGAGAADVADYAETLQGEAERGETTLGDPRWDDDCYAEKLDLLCESASRSSRSRSDARRRRMWSGSSGRARPSG